MTRDIAPLPGVLARTTGFGALRALSHCKMITMSPMYILRRVDVMECQSLGEIFWT